MSKKNIFITIIYLFVVISFCQAQLDSRKGYFFPTQGEYRLLNIFINIIYDVHPDEDPFDNKKEDDIVWGKAESEGINKNIPKYLTDYLDVNYNGPESIHGMMTRLFAESSFNKLILTGDFIIVNIRESRMGDNGFSWKALADTAVSMINRAGGVNNCLLFTRKTRSIHDYDRATISSSLAGKDKKGSDGRIDYILLMMRNSKPGYGSEKIGSGRAGFSVFPSEHLLINDKKYPYNVGSLQAVGKEDISNFPKGIEIHEFAHGLIGGNAFHSGGGHHYAGFVPTSTFLNQQGGHSLLGGANSGLISCNAFDRLRLGWNRQEKDTFLISANGQISDIKKHEGNKTFLLRDFITYGDAIRIQLPYVDPGAKPQFLWLENHQIGRNNKLDFLHYANTATCRDSGTAGIYMYYQIGNNIFTGTYNQVYGNANQADFIKPVSPEGNWDVKALPYQPVSCVSYADSVFVMRYLRPNPFCGVNDQTKVFLSPDNNKLALSDSHWAYKVRTNEGIFKDNLPFLGDRYDAFTQNSAIGLWTNPAPVPVLTCYIRGSSSRNNIREYKDNELKYKNNRHIYLSGLSIKMQEKEAGIFQVDIRWNDTKLKNDVIWSGSIVLKDTLIIDNRNKVELIQNLTPVKSFRDSVTDFFSPPTVFYVKNKANLVLEPHSVLELSETSTLVIEPGATLHLREQAEVIINKKCCIYIQQGANIILEKKSSVSVLNGGYIQLDKSADIISTEKSGKIKAKRKAIYDLSPVFRGYTGEI